MILKIAFDILCAIATMAFFAPRLAFSLKYLAL
jgi:hypothetical protein